ncbi:MAG: folate-binding protein [Gammaproteobacteria bacterium]
MKSKWKAFLMDAGAEFSANETLHYGNPAREREVALSGTVFSDLSHLGVIAAHGADSASFLQAQLSNDLSAVDDSSHQLSAYCNPKGRIIGLSRIFRTGGNYYLRLPSDTLDSVLQRLRMYVLRAAVTLEDASNNFIAIGVSGETAAAELAAVAGRVPEQENQTLHAGDLTVLRVPGIKPRFEVYASSLAAARNLWEALNVRAAPAGTEAWRLLEILAGMPTIYAGTADLFVPQMANLQLVDGVSFKKGCYPGQEIVARMQYLGTLKRRMYLGRIATDTVPLPGAALFSSTDNEQPIGRVIDAQPHPDGGMAALAVLQISAADAGDVHLAAADGAAFVQQPLPYAFE